MTWQLWTQRGVAGRAAPAGKVGVHQVVYLHVCKLVLGKCLVASNGNLSFSLFTSVFFFLFLRLLSGWCENLGLFMLPLWAVLRYCSRSGAKNTNTQIHVNRSDAWKKKRKLRERKILFLLFYGIQDCMSAPTGHEAGQQSCLWGVFDGEVWRLEGESESLTWTRVSVWTHVTHVYIVFLIRGKYVLGWVPSCGTTTGYVHISQILADTALAPLCFCRSSDLGAAFIPCRSCTCSSVRRKS